MCGIVGYAGRNAIEPEQLAAMSGVLTHRGPDDTGMWYSADRRVGFAHRRLSIIDLSPGGHQPQSDGGGTLHIAFNGEIYNYLEVREELRAKGHVFRTNSDTEVILESYKCWGEDFVVHLSGMFALALYDETKRQMFLARDRAGEKPLFVWQQDGRVVFASELKAIMALPDMPRRLDPTAFEHYLTWGYVARDLCILSGVRKLQPATILRIDVDSGATHERTYWELPVFGSTNGKPKSDGELVDELDALLFRAVKRQLLAADVPVGVLLSGGVDSSLVTAMAARASSTPVRTFTVTFPGHDEYDEAPHARLVANYFGTNHVALPAETVGADLLPTLARQYDEPLADSSMIPTYLVSRLIRQHATVALGGDGGDELFGGYPSYVYTLQLQKMQQFIPAFLRRPIASAADRLPITARRRNILLAVGEQGLDVFKRINVYFNKEWRQALLTTRAGASFDAEGYRLALAHGAQSILQAAQRIDFRSYLPDDILVKVDRASMLTSLEVRAPFLDPAVIEFAYGSVPDRLKTTIRKRKVLLRMLGQRLLPKELDLKRKQGFSVPLQAWFAGEWGTYVRQVLAEAPLFHQQVIDDLFAAQTVNGNHGARLFALTFFELWRREYGVTM